MGIVPKLNSPVNHKPGKVANHRATCAVVSPQAAGEPAQMSAPTQARSGQFSRRFRALRLVSSGFCFSGFRFWVNQGVLGLRLLELWGLASLSSLFLARMPALAVPPPSPSCWPEHSPAGAACPAHDILPPGPPACVEGLLEGVASVKVRCTVSQAWRVATPLASRPVASAMKHVSYSTAV